MGSQSACHGTLSADEFYISAKALCDQWNSANTDLPNWTWIPSKRMPVGASSNEGYLSLESIYHIKLPKDLVSSRNILEEEEEREDCATMVQASCNLIHTYDFHIAYSFSYKTPVLYFKGHQSDGQPLDLDDIHKDLPEYSQNLLRESKWTFITVEEHPYLRRHWYMLHPCGTSDLMTLLLQGNTDAAAKYLFSWLSVVSQAVGLRIPIDLINGCVKVDSS